MVANEMVSQPPCSLIETLETPSGLLAISCQEGAVTSIQLHHGKTRGDEENREPSSFSSDLLTQIKKQLADYFSGIRRSFSVPIKPEGTSFQKAVWQLLLAIPYGKTSSYSDIAKKIGQPNAARAVGMACKRNPLPLLIPCHRVIAKDGSLGGFSLGGVGVKEKLINHETLNHRKFV